MNYHIIYQNLIERAQNRIILEYTETHHILPRCMGGADDKENLVELTPEEHYLAHQLLVKMHPENAKLVFAAVMMTCNSYGKRSNNKLYGWLRRKSRKQHMGNPGRPYPCDESTKLKISKANTGKIRSEEARQRYSKAKKGIIKTEDDIRKRTETRKKNREQRLKLELLVKPID